MKIKEILFFILCLLLFDFTTLKANTAFFSSNDSKIFAKNFDWKVEHGFIFKNLKGQKKYGYGWTANKPASWTSKYGSITFNQFGKEFPLGGMNEEGLVVEQILLPNSIFLPRHAPVLSNYEWVQYQLDNYASLCEVLDNLESLSIYPLDAVQFMVADSHGQGAIISFQDGEVYLHVLQDNHLIATTEKHTFSEKYALEKELVSVDNFETNLDRYVFLNGLLQKVSVDDVDLAFGILAKISSDNEPYKTQWSIVYDLGQRKINYKSSKYNNIKTLDFESLDFSEFAEVETVNIHDSKPQLKPYTKDANRFLFQKSQLNRYLTLNEDLLFEHFDEPGTPKMDLIYQQNHKDLIFRFITKEPKGLISFVMLKKEGTFPPKYLSVKTGQFLINNKETVRILYGVPVGEIALACFQDPEFVGTLNNNILGASNDYRFLKSGNGRSGMPPKYYDANLYIKDDTEIIVKIK
jgi:penicillin V acylase-like amidase (Ntn superfamily)/uncharacterized protein (DUF2141 family)